MLPAMVADALDRFAPRNVHADQWDTDALKKFMVEQFGLDMAKSGIDADQLNRQELGDVIFEKLKERYDAKEKQLRAGCHALSRTHDSLFSVLDTQWKRPSAQHGPPERRHQSARLWAARSAWRSTNANRLTCLKA